MKDRVSRFARYLLETYRRPARRLPFPVASRPPAACEVVVASLPQGVSFDTETGKYAANIRAGLRRSAPYRAVPHRPGEGEPQKGKAQEVTFNKSLIGHLLCNKLFQASNSKEMLAQKVTKM